MSEWISVRERLPDTDDGVLFVASGDVFKGHYTGSDWYSAAGGYYNDVTHWMPLPKPPDEYVHVTDKTADEGEFVEDSITAAPIPKDEHET